MDRKFNIGDRVVIKTAERHGKITYINTFWNDYEVELDDGTKVIMVSPDDLVHESDWAKSDYKVVIVGSSDSATVRYYKGNKMCNETVLKRDSNGDIESTIRAAVELCFPTKTDAKQQNSTVEDIGYMKSYSDNGKSHFEGYVGVPTELKTTSGEPLYVGDTVIVYAERYFKREGGGTYIYTENLYGGLEIPIVCPEGNAHPFSPEPYKCVYHRVHKYDEMAGKTITVFGKKICYSGKENNK